jgi:hypothetical protein
MFQFKYSISNDTFISHQNFISVAKTTTLKFYEFSVGALNLN